MIERHDGEKTFHTTSDFWECECAQGLTIHSDLEPGCPYCGCSREDGPDARVEEMLEALRQGSLHREPVLFVPGHKFEFTGGNCTALVRRDEDGYYFILTDADGLRAPVSFPFSLGIFKDEHICTFNVDSTEDIERIEKGFRRL